MTNPAIIQLQSDQVDAFRSLITIFHDVFAHTTAVPDDAYLRDLLANPDFMVFVVSDGHQVLGGLTVFVLHGYYGLKPLAYIYDVGITPTAQGKGYGSMLMQAVCEHCKANGFESAYVEAEADDNEAIAFYRKTAPGSEMPALHFNYPLD